MSIPAAGPRVLLAGAVCLLLAVLYTHPVLPQSGVRIASDRYDPVLNASILWWNATTVPFSPRWWTPPHYFPSEGVAAFTENLVGLAPIATPLYWLTGDPLRTYNLMFVLTWPLSAVTAFWLVYRLTRRADAAWIAGLAFAFAPYRLTQIAHLQVLACFWFPLALAGLHGYVADGRRRWLVLFGSAWLLQSLTNGYFLLFGAVIIGMWLAYFCSTRAGMRAGLHIGVAWLVASLPLLPVLLTYRAVHDTYGLRRDALEMLTFSADSAGWLGASPLLAFWQPWLLPARPEAGLFPGITVVVTVLAAVAWLIARGVREPVPGWQRPARLVALAFLALAIAAGIALFVAGPFRIAPFGVPLRMSGLGRALAAIVLLGAALVALTPALGASLARRSPLLFYTLATAVIGLFAMGPILRAGGRTILDPGPYALLMLLPGFDGLRVPTRFWMLGALCLAVAAGLAFARLAPRRGWPRPVGAVVLSAGILADGWIREMPMANAPERRETLDLASATHPLLELPLGPDFDAAATYRAVGYGRRVVNGVSGYEPPHYQPMQRALRAREVDALLALTAYGPLDVTVDGWNDEDGAIEQYVAQAPGAMKQRSDDRRTVYRLPAAQLQPPPAADRLSVVSLTASDDPAGAALAADGDVTTAWTREPQLPGQWLQVDLGEPRQVTAVEQALGRRVDAFPRHLEILTSIDGTVWTPAWEGPTVRHALEGAMRHPADARMVFMFDPRPARFVRLRNLALDANPWSVAALAVYGHD